MTQKHLLWLGGALVLALLGALMAGVFDDDVSTVRVPEVAIEADDVSSFEVHSRKGAFTIEKRASGWMLTSPISGSADSNTVAQFLSDLEELELTSVVSQSPDRYERFGVDSAGTVLSVTSGGKRRTFILGGRSTDYASNYLRVDDDERVFLSRKAVDVPGELDRWRDRTILSIRPADVQQAVVTGAARSYTVSREENGWTIDGADADSAAVQRWLGRFYPMLADGFYREPADADSSYRLHVQFVDEESRTLDFIPRDGDFAVELAGTESIFRLRGVRFDQFVPERSYFVAP